MVKRQISQNEYVQPYVAKNNAMGEIANALESGSGLAQTYAEIKKKEDQTKMNDFLAEANVDAMAATQQWKVDNASDPMNPEKLRELDKQYDGIFGQYTDKISMESRKDWINVKQKVKNQYLTNNAQWGLTQVVTNAETSLNNGIEKANKTSYLYGQQGDYANAEDYFNKQSSALRSAATGLLPDQGITESISNFRSDYTKNFVLGAIERDVDGAEELLAKESTQKNIDSPEAVEVLKKAIEAKKIKNSKAQAVDQYNNQKAFNDTMDKMNTGEQLAELERGKLTGRMNSKWAEAKKETILSAKGIDAQTQNEEFAKLSLKIGDAGKMFDKKENLNNSRKYLNDINQISIDIEKAQASGRINSSAAKQLTKRLYTETTSAATGIVAEQWSPFTWGINNSHNMFKRGLTNQTRVYEAVREYFNETDHQDFPMRDRGKMIKVTEQIIDRYNLEDRQESLNAVEALYESEVILQPETKERDEAEGQLMQDPETQKIYLVFPDGTYKEKG